MSCIRKRKSNNFGLQTRFVFLRFMTANVGHDLKAASLSRKELLNTTLRENVNIAPPQLPKEVTSYLGRYICNLTFKIHSNCQYSISSLYNHLQF